MVAHPRPGQHKYFPLPPFSAPEKCLLFRSPKPLCRKTTPTRLSRETKAPAVTMVWARPSAKNATFDQRRPPSPSSSPKLNPRPPPRSPPAARSAPTPRLRRLSRLPSAPELCLQLQPRPIRSARRPALAARSMIVRPLWTP